MTSLAPQESTQDSVGRSKTQVFHKHQMLLREGQAVPMAFMVKRGKVAVFRSVNNRKVVVDEAGPGDFVGVHSVLTGQPYHANAEAADFVEALPLDGKVLNTLILQSPNPVQRMVRAMASRLSHLESVVKDHTTPNTLLAVCQILELAYTTAVAKAGPRNRNAEPVAMPVAEVSRAIRNVLLIPQAEIELILEGLASINQIELKEIKHSRYQKNIFGEMEKNGTRIQDRTISIVDPDNFLNVARNLAKEEEKTAKPPFTRELAFMDMPEFSEAVDSTYEILEKKLAGREIPLELLYVERSSVMDWARQKGDDFFKKVTRKRLNVGEMECVDDITMVDDPTLQDVFGRLGFRKLTLLYAAAGEEARQKMEANMSRKITTVVKEESAGMQVSEMEQAEVEHEMLDLIKALKAPKA